MMFVTLAVAALVIVLIAVKKLQAPQVLALTMAGLLVVQIATGFALLPWLILGAVVCVMTQHDLRKKWVTSKVLTWY